MGPQLTGRRFGPFELNLDTGELRKHGTRINLPPQAFQMLALLSSRPGELVTREEIRLALWPNETVVEWEHSINTAIKRIRAALGDGIAEPVYVETLRGRGYRFLGKIEPCLLSPVSNPGGANAEPASPIGRQVSHYRVLEVIGKGGMGLVYKAEDLRLGRQVALKFLPLERLADPVAVARFEREARTASALNHPNICTIYDVEIASSGAFIAMELLTGETLRERIRASAPISTGQLIDLAMQIADALGAAHQRDIVHRDIKPENIFLTRRGEAKVLDFGLAKPASGRNGRAIGDDSSANLTSIGAAPGTAAYMSPEQSRGEELDARSDLFSFGVVLHEAATRREASHPPRLLEIIARLADRDPAMRYQSAADAASDLQRLKQEISGFPPALPSVGGQAPVTRRRTTRLAAAGLAGLVILITAFAIWRLLPSSRTDAPLIAQRLTSDPGFHVAADFSPDGKQIVYCWNGNQEKNYDIYILTLGSSQPRRLTFDGAMEYSPAWSPDGRFIAFLSGPEDGVAALMVLPAAGGPARKVSDTSMRVAPLHRRIEWSRDGRWIVMEGEDAPKEGYALSAVDVQNGARHPITRPGADQADLQPAVSPDGRTLAYIKDVGNGVSSPYLLSLSAAMTPSGEPRRLPLSGFQNVIITYPRWLPGGRDLIFVSNQGGPNRLWRAPLDGHSAPIVLASLGEGAGFPAVSPDGKRLVFSRFSSGGTVWSAGTEPSGPSPSRVTASAETDATPDFSPDGSQIAFGSSRSGSTEIWVSGRNGDAARQLTNYNGPGTGSPRWSPDGKWIVYDSRVEGQPDIYSIPSSGGSPVRLTSDPAADVSPSWSPDGRWIYFCSGRSGGRQVWRMPAGGGAAEQITRFGGCHPRLSPDGKTVYYMKQAGVPVTSLWKAPAEGGEELLVVNNVLDRCFALYGRRLYYAARQPGEPFASQYYRDLSATKAVLIRRLSEPLSSGFAISPDGAALLYRQNDRRDSNLMLVNDLH